jgi:GT2 family glycosyltransferase
VLLKNKTEIIIVKYNLPEYERQCISSVYNNTSNFNLTVFDNYPKNQNLGKLWNKLINKSECQYICLLNSDTVVFPNWLDMLLETFKIDKKVGIVGPTTNSSKNHQSLYKHKAKFIDYGASYPNYCLSGFCLLFPKKVWKKVGGFPKDFPFYGQEVLFIDKIVKAGFKQVWRTDVFVYHRGSASVKKAEKEGLFDEKEERIKGNLKVKRERLKNKLKEVK